MAVLRSDIIIPEIFTPYLIEESTRRDSFLQSGVVQPLAQLNASEDGGDFVNIPFYNANLAGDFEVLSDSSSLTPGKITADKQVGVVLHRGRAFESRDLAALASGSDPLSAIGQKMANYVNHQRQKDLLACLDGVFGSVNNTSSAAAFFDLTIDGESGDTPTSLSPRQVSQARALLGDQGEKLNTICMHSKTYYELVERRAVDYVKATDVAGGDATASGGSIANAYGDVTVPPYLGMRVIVSDDVSTVGSGASTEYAVYMFSQGSVGSGEQAGIQTESDRDILAKSSALSLDLHYVYHPVGAKWAVTDANPNRTQLATVSNWSKVYELKNIGIVRATVVSAMD